jgi:hypothetical protein
MSENEKLTQLAIDNKKGNKLNNNGNGLFLVTEIIGFLINNQIRV